MSHPDKTLIESLETYKDLFDHAHDLIHIVYPDGIILYVNHAWQKHLEYSQEEVQGNSIYSIVIPEYKEAFIHYRQNLIDGIENDKEIIVGFQSKFGKRVMLEGFLSLRKANEKPLYTRGIFRDISVRLNNERQLKVLNETLQERETNLRQLLTYAPDAVIVIDTESIITYWNPKAATVFGWTEEEAIGKKLSDTIIPTQFREAHYKGMSRYLATGEARVLNQTIELTAINKESKEFYISLTISNTKQNGKPAFIAFVRNIDKEKRNEIELEKKRKELEQSNEELEQFAHIASHDLKEPVRKIHIFADHLKRELGNNMSPNAKKYLDRIEVSASRLTTMIERILEHSSVNTLMSKNEEVDLNAVIAQVLFDLEFIIKNKKALVQVSNLPRVNGAVVLLYQLFYNLISNSLKFIRPGAAPFIQIEEHRSLEDDHHMKPYTVICVKDNGIGFSNESATTIFKKFSRLHSKDAYEGTGLGLAVCKNIVEKHNGRIVASSDGWNGAVFTIFLPSLKESGEE